MKNEENSQVISIGQCWISEMEPELGLGIVVALEHRRARIRFEAGECERIYAIASAPIKRVQFSEGDKLSNREGAEFTVESVQEKDGLFIYFGSGLTVVETDLSPRISFTTPENRLTGGHVDSNLLFNIRRQALYSRSQILQSPVHGFAGGRIDLIPHQLYIAHEVSSRKIPRALLADEVGLGKTIEACLILHRLLVSGRISRVLILVPEVLINQWFVELLRRFNLLFRIIDEDYMLDVEDSDEPVNPFDTESLVLCSSDFFEYEPERMAQVLEVGWDMLIIDEAHHLKDGSYEYELVSKLAGQTPGLLLLTATPEQLGLYNHFERLRLLDSARYSDYESFKQESDKYHHIAQLGNKILDNQSLSAKEIEQLAHIFKDDAAQVRKRLQSLSDNNDAARKAVVSDLIDRHGIGRVMFRNTRKAMPDFPKRVVDPVKMRGNKKLRAKINQEFTGDSRRGRLTAEYDFSDDPRVDWIVKYLDKKPDDKILLICRTRRKALALHEAIQKKVKVKTALFHEGMSIIQRDRNAAWFSEPEGARMLISSEIGSEGRNFQFAHHMVFIDLPANPELLEQRIGRLDRIGQKSSIFIHVLFVPDTAYALLFTWYQEGLNAFSRHIPGLYQVYEKFKSQLWDLLKKEAPDEEQVEKLIKETRKYTRQLEKELESGRDRLLEMNSFRPETADEVVNVIHQADTSKNLDNLMHCIWDHFGIISEDVDIDKRTFRLIPGDLKIDAFPGFSEKGMIVTFDRQKALEREDVSFLTADHPMVKGSLDLVLGSELGNCTLAAYRGTRQSGVLLEVFFVLESTAPLRLQVDRFLPPTPIRVLVDHTGKDHTDSMDQSKFNKALKSDASLLQYLENIPLNELLPQMLKPAQELAEKEAKKMIKTSLQNTDQILGDEVNRLVSLQKINDHISNQEISLARQEFKEIKKEIKSARVRLDATRLIFLGDPDDWEE